MGRVRTHEEAADVQQLRIARRWRSEPAITLRRQTVTIQTQWICPGPWCHCGDSVTECDCWALSDGMMAYCSHCGQRLILIDFATGEVVTGEALA
jgi:hypothetical protein